MSATLLTAGSVLARRCSGCIAVPLVHRGIRLSALGSSPAQKSKLDELFWPVVDFPSRHIGPRKHEAKDMLRTIGYEVRVPFVSFHEQVVWIPMINCLVFKLV